MRKPLEDLNFKLPDIKWNSQTSKSVKGNNKNIILKLNDKDIIRIKRNIDIENHFKNLSRNTKNIIMASNEKEFIKNIKDKNYLNKKNFNDNSIQNLNTLNNNTNFMYSSVDNLNSNNNKNRKNTPLSIFDISEFKSNNIKIPNTINSTKNSSYLSFRQKNRFSNNFGISNFSLYKNKNPKNNSIFNIINNKKVLSYNEDILKPNNFTQNDIKILLSKEAYKKAKRSNYENQIRSGYIKNNNNLNNLKFQLIMPKIKNSSEDSKKFKILENIEDKKVSKNINNINKINLAINDKFFKSQPIMLKELRNIENLNHINNFIMILKQYILIEIELNEFININNQLEPIINSKVKNIINLYNNFFNQLDYISFEVNIFVNKDFNFILQKILKLLIYFHCFIFIFFVLNDTKYALVNIKTNFIDILRKISFCLYNTFTKFIYKELSNNKYKDLSFVPSLNTLFNNNIEYIIKSTLSNNEIYALILRNYNICLERFIKILNNKVEGMEEVSASFKNLLLNINKNDLIYHIDLCLNTFLYTVLEKNIKKAKLNSKNNNSFAKTKSLTLVPYLPPPNQNHKYTIVLDVDETLGHFIYNDINSKYFTNYGYIIEDSNRSILNNDNKDKIRVGIFLIRPYAKYFLEKLNNLYFEIVIFSAGTKEYCDKVLDILDLNNNLIKFRLYRSHLSLRNINNDVKDLSLLGRDLSKVIMIDNFSENYKLQENNGLPINSWIGDANDTSLRDLIPIMNYIVEKNIEDVRDIVKKVKIQLNHFSKTSFNYDKINLKF